MLLMIILVVAVMVIHNNVGIFYKGLPRFRDGNSSVSSFETISCFSYVFTIHSLRNLASIVAFQSLGRYCCWIPFRNRHGILSGKEKYVSFKNNIVTKQGYLLFLLNQSTDISGILDFYALKCQTESSVGNRLLTVNMFCILFKNRRYSFCTDSERQKDLTPLSYDWTMRPMKKTLSLCSSSTFTYLTFPIKIGLVKNIPLESLIATTVNTNPPCKVQTFRKTYIKE